MWANIKPAGYSVWIPIEPYKTLLAFRNSYVTKTPVIRNNLPPGISFAVFPPKPVCAPFATNRSQWSPD